MLALPGLPAFTDGTKCVHDTTAGKDGLRLSCKWHAGCEKYRSLRMDPFGHDRRAAEWYLGAWMERGEHIPKEAH